MANRLLVLTSYPERMAATRHRILAYFPALRAAGVEPELVPFLDDEEAARLYLPGSRAAKGAMITRALSRRAALSATAGTFRAIFVQREAALLGPPLLEWVLVKRRGIPLVFDLDDAIWMDQSHRSGHPLLARVLKRPQKTFWLFRAAARVLAGNSYLARVAAEYNPNVVVVPTVVSAADWTPLPGRLEGAMLKRGGLPTIGWLGSHATAPQLAVIAPAVLELARRGFRFRVRVVGGEYALDVPGIPVECVPWSASTEKSECQAFDIGVAPLFDEEWTRGKCSFKQIQYMAVGVPLVSSPFGSTHDVVSPGQNGLFAATTDEWVAALSRLLTDQGLRAELARGGRASVTSRFSLEQQASTVVGAVIDAMSSGASGPSGSVSTQLEE